MEQGGCGNSHHERKCDKKMISLFIKRKTRNKSIRNKKGKRTNSK
jgi:hypothetical protein